MRPCSFGAPSLPLIVQTLVRVQNRITHSGALISPSTSFELAKLNFTAGMSALAGAPHLKKKEEKRETKKEREIKKERKKAQGTDIEKPHFTWSADQTLQSAQTDKYSCCGQGFPTRSWDNAPAMVETAGVGRAVPLI